MDPIRRKLSSFLIKTIHEGIDALDPQSPCAKQLSEFEDIDTAITEWVERICQAATLPEITKIFVLAAQLRKTSGEKRNSIKSNLKKISEVLVARAETKSGPLELPQSCRHILLEI